MPNLNKTHITCILDRSGSMSSIAAKTIEGFNGIISERKHTTSSTKEVTATLCLFDHEFHTVHNMVNVHEIPELTSAVYYARGTTALYDSMAKGINLTRETIAALPVEDRPANVFVIVMTDGEENGSQEFRGETGRVAVKALVEDIEKAHTKDETSPCWNVVFMGANIDAAKFSESVGVRKNNSAQYTSTNEGTVAAYASLSRGIERAETLCIPSFESDFGFFDAEPKIPEVAVDPLAKKE
jgi:hypothetical protein